MLKSFFKSDQVEFLCAEEDWDVIPKPYSAKHFIPDWYKALPMKLGDKGLNQSTVKRCVPFLDAMSVGWIIPTPADVSFNSNDDCSIIDYRWTYHKSIVEQHSYGQVTHPKKPRPGAQKPPLKYMNYWFIKPAPGYSILFVPPINRPDPRLNFFSGLVDCDVYPEYINFPFTFEQPNFHGIIPAGTPMVQAIPIKREDLKLKASFKKADKKYLDNLAKVRRQRNSHESLYRDKLVEKK